MAGSSLHVLATAGMGALLAVLVWVASRRVVALWRNLLSGCTNSIGSFNQNYNQNNQNNHRPPLQQLLPQLQRFELEPLTNLSNDYKNDSLTTSDSSLRHRNSTLDNKQVTEIITAADLINEGEQPTPQPAITESSNISSDTCT